MSRVNLGRVTMMPKGVWNSSSTYKRLDIVTNNGVSYIALQDVPANTAVTNTTYWMAVTPDISIGDVSTVSSYESASASMGNDSSGKLKLNLSIPRGVSEQEDILHSATGSIVSFSDGIEAPAAQVKVKIEPIQEGEGDPSPDNVRPITGWTGVKVIRTGKNLLPLTNIIIYSNTGITWTVQNDGTIIANGTTENSNAQLEIIFDNLYGYFYYIGCPNNDNNICDVFAWDTTMKARFKKWNQINYCSSDTNYTPQEIFIPKGHTGRICLRINKNTTVSNLIFKPMIIKNDETDITYEPYQGDTYSITFPSEVGTVYGGELDVTSGKLTVTKKYYLFNGSENWYEQSAGSNVYVIDCENGVSNVGPMCNMFKWVNVNSNEPDNSIRLSADKKLIYVIHPTIASNLTEFKTYLVSHNLQVCYDLTTPLIYQLTLTEVTTLLGQNNIWADTGDTSVIYWQNKALADVIHSKFLMTEDLIGAKKYGVKGIGQASSELTRTYDSVNMVATVGSPTKYVRNDFDYAAPFMRRKCVGYWEKNPQHDKRAMFHVMAYEGDDNYTEDGTVGDYVAVECPRCYYKRDGDELIISAYKHQGFRAFDIFCHEHNQNDTMEFYYMPAYPLALKDGHAVSLPGLRNEQGDWATLYNNAKTYNNEEVAVLAQLMPAAVNFYEWALMTVEFATQNMQNIMYGVAECYNADSKVGQFTSLEGTITFECNDNLTGIIVGDYVRIGTYSGGSDNRTLPSHKVLTATSSNSKRILTLEPTDWSTISYTTGTNYYISGSHVPTGLTKDILTPSGIENHTATNTHNAIRYRYHENPYGNQYHTSADLFDVATIILDATTTSVNVKYGASLDWYYLPDATSITTAVNPANNTTSLSTDERFVKLGVSTPSEKYVSGYIKNIQYDIAYPDIWAPETTEGGSATTYFSDQAYLVASHICRSCRFGGNWYFGTSAGPLSLSANSAPSSAYASFGGDLYFPQ